MKEVLGGLAVAFALSSAGVQIAVPDAATAVRCRALGPLENPRTSSHTS